MPRDIVNLAQVYIICKYATEMIIFPFFSLFISTRQHASAIWRPSTVKTDVSPYAHCVFRAFDIRHNGVINFEVRRL